MPSKQVQFNYITLEDALSRAEKQKELYERNLVGKSFIYAYVDNNNAIAFKEIHFGRENYLHLTGLDYQSVQYNKRVLGIDLPTDALNFYNRLGKDATLINDVSFIIGSTPDETTRFFKYTQQKLDNLSQLTAIVAKAEYIGKYKGNQAFDIIVNRNSSAIAFIRDNNAYIPVSSLYGKAEDVAMDIKPIFAIFSKEKDTHQFTLEYLNKNISLKNTKMDIGLSQRLNLSSFENKAVSFNRNQLNELVSIYKSSVKYDLTKQLNELALKREKAFNSEADMNDYMKSFNNFLSNINEEHQKDIAIELLSNEMESNTDSLIADEISAINEKFGSGAPVLSAPTASKSIKMSTIEDKSIPMNLSVQGGAVALSPTVPPNDIFTKMANALVKGLDIVVHKASIGIEKLNRAVTDTVNSLFAPETHSEARSASQSKSKGISPKKKKVAENTRSVAPVKRSVNEQEGRTSIVGQIKELQAAQDKHTQAHQRTKSKSNDIEI